MSLRAKSGTAARGNPRVPPEDASTSFYQTIEEDGFVLPQEPALNFVTFFDVTDNAGVSTDVTLNIAAVTAAVELVIQIEPDQITPGNEGDVLTVVAGVATWAAPTAPSLPLQAPDATTIIQGRNSTNTDWVDLMSWGVDVDNQLQVGGDDVQGMELLVDSGTTFVLDIGGTDEYSFSSSALALGANDLALTGNILQGATVSSTGNYRTLSVWSLVARNNADGADVDLLQKDNTDLIIVGDSTDASGIEFKTKAATTFIWDVAGTDEMTLSATALDISSNNLALTGNILQGATVSGTGNFRTLSVWILAARNNANSADVDLLQKTSADLVIIGDSTDASGVEFKTKSATTFIWDIAATDEMTLSATQLDISSNNLALTGNILQGATVSGTGNFRTLSVWILAARNNAASADVDLLQKTSADLIIIGDSTDASGVEFKTKTATTFIFDIAGTDEYTMSATTFAMGSNDLTLTGTIQQGAIPSATGDFRVNSVWSLKGRDNGNTADLALLEYAGDVLTVGGGVSGLNLNASFVGGVNIAIGGATEYNFSATGADFILNDISRLGVLRQGTTVSSTGNYRTESVWLLAARNNANSADVDLIQKTNADLVIVGDSTDASGIEFKTKSGTSFIFDIAGTDEYILSATSWSIGANDFALTGNILQGATVSGTGNFRTLSVWILAARNNANSADVDLLQKTSADLIIIGDSTDASGVEFKTKTATTFIFDVAGADAASIGQNSFSLTATGATTWSLTTSAVAGTGNALTISGEARSANSGTPIGGALTINAGDATGAGATHTGGLLLLRGGDALSGSGTRNGGGFTLRPGSGATANGTLDIQSGNGTSRFKVNTTGIGFFNATPVAQQSVNATLTGASGSSGSAIADVGAAFSQTTLNNNFRRLQDAVNAFRTVFVNLGLAA